MAKKLTNPNLKELLVTLPILYLFVSIFMLRSEVGYFFLVSGALLAYVAWFGRKFGGEGVQMFAYWLIALSAVGLSASTILSIEKVELLMDPDHTTSCSLSPIVACSPVIESEQASALGFPNPLLGIFAFSTLFAAGMTIVAGTSELHRNWWRTALGGTIFGGGFSFWLIFQAFYRINSLCLYCMAVWIVSFALFWLVASSAQAAQAIRPPKALAKLLQKPMQLIIITYILLAGLIFVRWSDYWLGLL